MYFPQLTKRRTSNRLAKLMELYETNYLLMRLLVPKLRLLENSVHYSKIEGCIDLKMDILERCKYTTTLKLGYKFSAASRKQGESDFIIRIYHDARTAEAMSGLIHGQRREQRRVRDLDEGWILNRFLSKWIRYCLHRGHRFHASDNSEAIRDPVA